VVVVVVVVPNSTVVVVGAVLVVVVGATVVVVGGGSVVVVGATVVVVGSTVLTGAGGSGGSGWVVGATVGPGGGVAEGGGLVPPVVPGAAVAGVWAARAIGEFPGGPAGSVAAVVEDPALEGATEGGGSVEAGAPVVAVGRGAAAVGVGGTEGTRAAEATIAARTAKVSPNATSIRRRGRWRSARWRGFRGGMRRAAGSSMFSSGSGSYGLSDPMGNRLRHHGDKEGKHAEEAGWRRTAG
jgi:hypothetical protein